MKTTADVVIIGGGIAGASVAYHLAEAQAAGLTVVLLEQRTLASGTTGKSVAVLEFQHSTAPDIRLRQRSLATYQRFFQQPDSGVCFQQIGGIQLTATQPAADDLRETVRLQQRLGVSVEW